MLFSVIVPCYNVSAYIRQCIESILSQTFADFELILVNDGSKDCTLEILKEYEAGDVRIRVIDKPNGGLVSARKAGAIAASGDYIVVVDGDDFISEDYLEDFASVIRSLHPDIVSCGYTISFIDKEKEVPQAMLDGRYGLFEKGDLHTDLYEKGIAQLTPNLWSKVFRKELYMKYQMKIDNMISMGEDGVVTYPCLYDASSLYLTSGTGYFYRVVHSSMTRDKRKYIPFESARWRVEFLRIHLPDMEEQVAAYAIHSYFTSAASIMNRYPYGQAVKTLEGFLTSSPVVDIFKAGTGFCSFKEHIARQILKNRIYPLLKLIAILRR